MKILHVIATLGPGGAEAFVSSLSIAMAEKNQTVAVYLLAGAHGERGMHLLSQLHRAGVIVYGSKPKSAWSLSNLVVLARLMKVFQPDIVHAHLFSAEVVCLVVSKFLRIKKSCLYRTLHSTDIIGTRNSFLIKIMDKFYGVSIACSEAVGDAYKVLYDNKYCTTMLVINNGVRPPSLMKDDSELFKARNRLGISHNDYVVVNVGAFRGERLQDDAKAHDFAVKTFAAFNQYAPNAILFFVGDGALRAKVERIVADYGLVGNVRFTGNIPDPSDYLMAADVFFFPSRKEGLPISLLEAAMYGLPVVASDIPEIRNLDRGYPWRLSKVDSIDGYLKNLIFFYQQELQYSPAYVKSVVENYGIACSAERYISTYKV